MARPIKRLRAEPEVVKELRRRARATTIGVRDRERAEIILRRLEGVGVEAVAATEHHGKARVAVVEAV